VDGRLLDSADDCTVANVVRPHECTPWSEIAVATPLRTTLDLLLDRPLPDAVADLHAVLRARLVTLPQVIQMIEGRSDKGIVLARRAIELADPRAESRPESRVLVWLVLDGLHPVPQYWIEDGSGRLARADLAFPEHEVAVGTTAPGERASCGRATATGTGSTGCKLQAGRLCSSPHSCSTTPRAWSAPSAPRSAVAGNRARHAAIIAIRLRMAVGDAGYSDRARG
jgi:hypothetical protein